MSRVDHPAILQFEPANSSDRGTPGGPPRDRAVKLSPRASEGDTFGVRRGLALLLISTPAFGDVSVGASIGAGAQGTSAYSALDLRLDAAWPNVRLGLGARGVWDDAAFRTSDWASPWHAITIVRDAEASYEIADTELAIAAGALAPARVGHVVDDYRVALDDRWRTGVRAAARSERSTSDSRSMTCSIRRSSPAARAGSWLRRGVCTSRSRSIRTHLRWRARSGPLRSRPASIGATTSRTCGSTPAYRSSASSGSAGRWSRSAMRTVEWGGIRWTARADARAGTGSVGSLFGPLYRIERLAHDDTASLWDRARGGELAGASAGIGIAAAAPVGWLELAARARPGLGGLVVVGGGAPMGQWVQAGVWAAIGERDAAGAAELESRVGEHTVQRIASRADLSPRRNGAVAVWSVTAWFGAATE